MDRKFSKDISGYKKDMWKGFTTEELIIIVTAVILGCVVTFITVKYLGISNDNAIYPASIVCVPVIYLYFKKEKDIPLIKVLLRKKNLKKTSIKFDYKSSEMKILEIEEREKKRLIDEEKRIVKRRKLL